MKLRLRAGVRVETTASGVILGDANCGQSFTDPFLPAVLELLEQGQHTEDEIAWKLRSCQMPSVTYMALHRLRQGNWLHTYDTPSPPTFAVHFLDVTPVELPPGFVVEGEGDIELVVCSNYCKAQFCSYARAKIGLWMPVCICAGSLWFGPIQDQYSYDHFHGLLQTLWANHQMRSGLDLFEENTHDPVAVSAGLSLARLQVLRNPEATGRHLHIYDFAKSQMSAHPLPRYYKHSPTRGVAKPDPRADRLLDSESLGELLAPCADRQTGVVTEINEVVPARILLPMYFASFWLMADARSVPVAALRQTQVGRSLDSTTALLGALAESIERRSAIISFEDKAEFGSSRELGDKAIHPNRSQLFSENQYGERETSDSFNFVPLPFDEDQVMRWSPVRSLKDDSVRCLPTALLYYARGEVFHDPGYQYALTDSNGCASGGCFEEAVWHGLLELVERDAVAIWWYNRLLRPAYDLDALGPEVVSLVKRFEACGERVWVLDLTHDLAIPVAAAVTVRRHGKQDPAFGFGCHPCAERAVMSALLEAVQWTANYERKVRPRGSLGRYTKFNLREERNLGGIEREALDWIEHHNTTTDPYLLPKGVSSPPEWNPHPTFAGEIEDIKGRLGLRGLEAFVVDYTRPQYPLHAVKVIVPGMRMFWRRLAPGRLYDVPVALGWLAEPLTEDQMNPVSLFL